MKYVLDSNISLKWVLTEADSDKARRLRGDFQNQIHELHAPDVFPVEVAHGLAKAERRGVIPQGDADRLLTNVLSTPPQFHPYLCSAPQNLDRCIMEDGAILEAHLHANTPSLYTGVQSPHGPGRPDGRPVPG